MGSQLFPDMTLSLNIQLCQNNVRTTENVVSAYIRPVVSLVTEERNISIQSWQTKSHSYILIDRFLTLTWSQRFDMSQNMSKKRDCRTRLWSENHKTVCQYFPDFFGAWLKRCRVIHRDHDMSHPSVIIYELESLSSHQWLCDVTATCSRLAR